MNTGTPGTQVLTKLVATIGPASSDPERLASLLNAGVDVCRLNFSHGRTEDHARVLAAIRAWSSSADRSIAVLGDLGGPKIRLNRVAGGQQTIMTGAEVRIVRGLDECTAERLTTNYPALVDELQPGQRIYIDDGLIRLLALDRTADEVICACRVGGAISDRKGVNLPDTQLSISSITDKDRRDAAWAVSAGLDFLGLSFARSAADVAALRALLPPTGGPAVIAKIEVVEAIHNLDEIIAAADGVMVARGDLGVQMDVWRVPLLQKEITLRMRKVGKPVIIATQMLQSMMTSPQPTRAEVSDVANAILDQADAVMLSGESAAGQFPLLAVEMMGLVAQAAEEHALRHGAPPNPRLDDQRPVAAIAEAAVRAALRVNARAIAVWSATGETVRLVAQRRPPMPVIGLSSDPAALRRMCLLYGVTPVQVEPLKDPGRLVLAVDALLTARGLARPDEFIVVVSSTRPTRPGETDTLLVHRVGDRPGE